jgi:hydroxyacylglutathione hydrolase
MNSSTAKDGIHVINEIAPKTYRIDEDGLANCYLLLGESSGLLIDSGVGAGDLLGTLKDLTSLPITLVATHRHCDHVGNRNCFKEYYVHPNDRGFIYALLSSKPASKAIIAEWKLPLKLSKKPYHSHIRYLQPNQTFDLGGRVISYELIPGHTKGSVIYLDPLTHIAFCGDDVNPYLWLQLPGCTNITTWLPGAKRVAELAKTYTLYAGHNTGLIARDEVVGLIALAEKIRALNGQGVFHHKTFSFPGNNSALPRITISKKNAR